MNDNPHQNPSITKKCRVLGGLWGSVTGDALGVPAEFKDRRVLQNSPVKSLTGYGTHNQPPGTWSDDSSLLLCTTGSLVSCEFDTEDIGRWFCDWYYKNLWTPHGQVFDVGTTTANAISRIAMETPAEIAGGVEEFNNGNGSLMRMIPVSLRFAGDPVDELLRKTHRASTITHGHPRTQIACGIFSLVVRELLFGKNVRDALAAARSHFESFYKADPSWRREAAIFRPLFEENFRLLSEDAIASGGYVVHTLAASLWCLLTTGNYTECVLKAVNLGGDTDTTGCVAGGLAGVMYGLDAIPPDWIGGLARKSDMEQLFDRFVELVA